MTGQDAPSFLPIAINGARPPQRASTAVNPAYIPAKRHETSR